MCAYNCIDVCTTHLHLCTCVVIGRSVVTQSDTYMKVPAAVDSEVALCSFPPNVVR